jgi:hypothetical protein
VPRTLPKYVAHRANGLAWHGGRQHLFAGGDRAFVACDAATVIVLDLTQDQELACLPIDGEPDAIWFNAARQRLYVPIGQPGLLDVGDCQRIVMKERVATEAGAHTTAFDARRRLPHVFLPSTGRAAAVYREIKHG